ncbi:helix-turn-helix domain-containing protein [Streptomyces platensis]|uniref:helix-turn-helix domain-containing protein n=1 Tax=Streptomyces platensis TaxID=58346 RepID=UPI0030DE1D2C
MTVSASSSAQQARQALAKRLADLCRDAELTGLELAEHCGWSRSKSSRIMNAKTPPSADDIRAWCRTCGAEDQTEDLIASLRTAEGMWVNWRRMERAGLRQAQEARLPLYQQTHRFRSYSSWLVPGMIQTQPYTTAALQAIQRRRGLVDDVADAVAARMERQRVLYEAGDRRFAFLIEESVLRAGIGGAEVMSGQLGHLMSIASLPHVSLGVVPMTPDRERWPAEGFWIYDAAQVNVELISGYLTITQPSEVAMYAETFAELAALAVYGAAARALITSAMNTLG